MDVSARKCGSLGGEIKKRKEDGLTFFFPLSLADHFLQIVGLTRSSFLQRVFRRQPQEFRREHVCATR